MRDVDEFNDISISDIRNMLKQYKIDDRYAFWGFRFNPKEKFVVDTNHVYRIEQKAVWFYGCSSEPDKRRYKNYWHKGVDPNEIYIQLRDLLDEVKFWKKHKQSKSRVRFFGVCRLVDRDNSDLCDGVPHPDFYHYERKRHTHVKVWGHDYP